MLGDGEDNMADGHIEDGMTDHHTKDSIVDGHTEDSTTDDHTKDRMTEGHTKDSMVDGRTEDSMMDSHAEDSLADDHTENNMVDCHTEDKTKELLMNIDANAITSTDCGEENCKGYSEFSSMPVYNFDSIPIQVTGSWKEFENSVDNYTRGCKWSPDGSCLMVCSDDNIIRLFNFPVELWNANFSWEQVKEMCSVLKVHEGSCIYDYCWYPLMSSADPLTSCFCSTSKDSPVHLWDAFTGELRCSYRPYNQVDEITTPNSLAFDSFGQKLFCGFKKMIRIFDVAIPGRDFIERPTYVEKRGQAGIISCFAFTPANPNMSAAGSFSKTIGIYSEPDGDLEHLLGGHQGGLNHLCFSPDGTKLYSGARKDFEILCWDLRNLSKPLCSLRRKSFTSQKMYFDVSKCGQFVASGNQNGVVTIWDVTKEAKEVASLAHPVLEPIQYFAAHKDCVNGVSLHPSGAFLATCSGERKFPDPADSDEENSSGKMFSCKSISRENSVRLWCATKFDHFVLYK